jgi:hypothetical protein
MRTHSTGIYQLISACGFMTNLSRQIPFLTLLSALVIFIAEQVFLKSLENLINIRVFATHRATPYFWHPVCTGLVERELDANQSGYN